MARGRKGAKQRRQEEARARERMAKRLADEATSEARKRAAKKFTEGVAAEARKRAQKNVAKKLADEAVYALLTRRSERDKKTAGAPRYSKHRYQLNQFLRSTASLSSPEDLDNFAKIAVLMNAHLQAGGQIRQMLLHKSNQIKINNQKKTDQDDLWQVLFIEAIEKLEVEKIQALFTKVITEKRQKELQSLLRQCIEISRSTQQKINQDIVQNALRLTAKVQQQQKEQQQKQPIDNEISIHNIAAKTSSYIETRKTRVNEQYVAQKQVLNLMKNEIDEKIKEVDSVWIEQQRAHLDKIFDASNPNNTIAVQNRDRMGSLLKELNDVPENISTIDLEDLAQKKLTEMRKAIEGTEEDEMNKTDAHEEVITSEEDIADKNDKPSRMARLVEFMMDGLGEEAFQVQEETHAGKLWLKSYEQIVEEQQQRETEQEAREKAHQDDELQRIKDNERFVEEMKEYKVKLADYHAKGDDSVPPPIPPDPIRPDVIRSPQYIAYLAEERAREEAQKKQTALQKAAPAKLALLDQIKAFSKAALKPVHIENEQEKRTEMVMDMDRLEMVRNAGIQLTTDTYNEKQMKAFHDLVGLHAQKKAVKGLEEECRQENEADNMLLNNMGTRATRSDHQDTLSPIAPPPVPPSLPDAPNISNAAPYEEPDNLEFTEEDEEDFELRRPTRPSQESSLGDAAKGLRAKAADPITPSESGIKLRGAAKDVADATEKLAKMMLETARQTVEKDKQKNQNENEPTKGPDTSPKRQNN